MFKPTMAAMANIIGYEKYVAMEVGAGGNASTESLLLL